MEKNKTVKMDGWMGGAALNREIREGFCEEVTFEQTRMRGGSELFVSLGEEPFRWQEQQVQRP